MIRKPLIIKFVIIIIILMILSGVYNLFNDEKLYKYKGRDYTDFSDFEEERVALESFLNKYFLEDGFLRTNLIDTEQGEIASGEDILSESIGLLMIYYLRMEEAEKFDREVNLLLRYFLNSKQLIKWRIRRGTGLETVNATIDDLRIVKALIKAADRWGREDYRDIAGELSARLLKHNVSGDKLKAFDCGKNPLAPLVYYDLKAMELMGQFDKKWSELATINQERILNNQVKDYPFYKDILYSEGQGFPTVENLMVLMHLSENGIKDPQSIEWLKEQLSQEGLFGSYSIEGKPLNTVESPAIYGITAIIAKLSNDRELYSLAIKRLKGMQNMENNQYYGGFIDLNNLSAFSFDQLFSLLAY